MYIISNKTLFLHFDGYVTNVDDREIGKLEFQGNLVEKILDASCIYYGSSFKGRIKGSQGLLNKMYKLPIVISEKNNILFFPIKLKDESWWINFNLVDNFSNYQNGIMVFFKNGSKINIPISYTIFNNQMLKSSRLWFIYLSRC